MEIRSICVLGGSGFVGRHLAQLLSARGIEVTVPTRRRERAKELILLPTVDVVEADVHDEATLEHLMRDADAVINLVGVLHDGRRNQGFAGAHAALARKVVAACRKNNIKRLLQMSALNADLAAPSAYLRSKGGAETIVRESGLKWTIFRPSVIFGRGDRFLNLFARMLRFMPVVALGSPNARFQPVWVEDVAQAFVHALFEPHSYGRSYDLCGPKVYTLRELVALAGAWSGHRRPIIGLNDTLSYLQASLLELLPVKLLTRDNIRSMQVPSICNCEFPFGIAPAALEAVAPLYLGRGIDPRTRYQTYRSHHDAP
ncbi:MAG TPA: complex I NDUFA9 subunit family protein [Burkholderiales bacterium]|nr:complex I NDUFA9 subunit family protein [Burkholderiales bacterium]